MNSYAQIEDYKIFCGSFDDADTITAALARASSDVDVLTYNRIRSVGFDRLSEFRKEVVREVVCRMAEFRINYSDLMENPYQTYAISGVSMSSGSTSTIGTHRGVMLPESVYAKLVSTGLCCGVIG